VARTTQNAGLAATVLVAAALAGCGSHDPAPSRPAAGSIAEARLQSRPIGAARRFHSQAPTRAVRDCRRRLGRRSAAHVELFAENRVVLIPSGIGTMPPRRRRNGRIVAARCYGPVVTLEPTGLVLVRHGRRATMGELFRQWGLPLSDTVAGAFRAPPGTRVVAFVNGRRWPRSPAAIPLGRHAAIVIEVGPRVPPHRFYLFPRGL
jgi:hypothetical protein